MEIKGLMGLLMEQPGRTICLRLTPEGKIEVGALAIDPQPEDWYYLPVVIESIAVDGAPVYFADAAEVNPERLELSTNGLKAHSSSPQNDSAIPAHQAGVKHVKR